MNKNKTVISRLFSDWILPIVIAVVIVAVIKTFLVYVALVPSSSMYPTIKVGDRIVATRVYNTDKLKRGDIVVFYSDELKETLVKRLIGLPGDKVEVNTLGQVSVNGTITDEPYVVNKDVLTGSFVVPKDKFLFMGDNRPVSVDSRRWKNPYIDKKDIKGKARFIIFPFSRIGRFVIGEEAVKR